MIWAVKQNVIKYIMGAYDLSSYCNQPCRFVLKSGKEVYGVIWKVMHGTDSHYCFLSNSEFNRVKPDNNDFSSTALTLRENDVLMAERIEIFNS